MRMKFNKSRQLLLVSAASLLAATLVTACNSTLTIDFVYVASSKAAGPYNYGEVDVFEINSESGFMRQIPTSPFPSGGRNPVAEAVSTDLKSLYVVNRDDNTIVQFAIGSDGKLYPQATVNTPGVYPMAVAVSGSFLFVVDTYQPLPTCSTASPCSGSIAVLPIGANGALGAPLSNGSLSYWPLALAGKSSADVLTPSAVNVLASGSNVYVTAYDAAANAGYVFGFAVGSGGALSALNGSPFAAGTKPSAIASDGGSKYVYVADYAKADVLGYAVASGSLTPLSGSPYPAGNQPSAIAVDPVANYAYVANSEDSTVTAYSLSGGALSRIGSYATGVQPVAMGIDPSSHHFLFTANFLGSNVTGFELSPTDGTLINSQQTPYPSNAQPSAVAAVPHSGS
jgi:6-phosphogluconolactonase